MRLADTCNRSQLACVLGRCQIKSHMSNRSCTSNMACAAQIYKGAGLGYGEYSPIEIMQMLGSILPCLLRQLRQRE